MIIVCGLLTKLFTLTVVFSALNVIRHLYGLFIVVMSDDDDLKYKITPVDLFYLGLSLALIITGIITGIGICV
jgi:hypothetical protein